MSNRTWSNIKATNKKLHHSRNGSEGNTSESELQKYHYSSLLESLEPIQAAWKNHTSKKIRGNHQPAPARGPFHLALSASALQFQKLCEKCISLTSCIASRVSTFWRNVYFKTSMLGWVNVAFMISKNLENYSDFSDFRERVYKFGLGETGVESTLQG